MQRWRGSHTLELQPISKWVQYSPLTVHMQAWKTMSRMCVCGGGGMQAMFCVDGICLVLKAVGWKNECSCIGRRRNAYSILWISLERVVRWERHILNTCFYICMSFNSFWRQHALFLTLCPYSALRSFPFHTKTHPPLMEVTHLSKSAVVFMCMCESCGDWAHICLWKHWRTGAAEITHPGTKPPPTSAALHVLHVLWLLGVGWLLLSWHHTESQTGSG